MRRLGFGAEPERWILKDYEAPQRALTQRTRRLRTNGCYDIPPPHWIITSEARFPWLRKLMPFAIVLPVELEILRSLRGMAVWTLTGMRDGGYFITMCIHSWNLPMQSKNWSTARAMFWSSFLDDLDKIWCVYLGRIRYISPSANARLITTLDFVSVWLIFYIYSTVPLNTVTIKYFISKIYVDYGRKASSIELWSFIVFILFGCWSILLM